MFNYYEIDKTPTVTQVKAIIEYMEKDPVKRYPFNYMLGMSRTEPNKIIIDLNDAHTGQTFEVIFDDNDEIVKFEQIGTWISQINTVI